MVSKSKPRHSLFSFLMYGNELLTIPSRRWLVITRTCVLILVTIEATSWSWAISQLGTTDTIRWLLGIATYLTFFCFLYMLDSSLITLDRGKTRYDEKIFPERKKASGGKWPWFTALKESLVASMVARAVVVSVSIFITAPFFTQLLFSRQVDQQMEQTENTRIREKRAAINAQYDTVLLRQKADLAKLEERLPKAIDGTAIPNKRFGFGPVSKEIKRQIDEKNEEIAHTAKDKQIQLDRFDELDKSHNVEQLRDIYNITIYKDSPQGRQEAMDELKKQPSIQQYELIIRSLLYVLFLVLLLFKFNEPAGVKIYLSDCLHECYGNYLEGKYNHLLLPQDRPGSGTLLKPYDFEKFMLDSYVKNLSFLATDATLQEIETRLKNLSVQGEELLKKRTVAQTAAGPSLDHIRKDLSAKNDEREKLEREIMAIQFRYASIADIYKDRMRDLSDLEASLKANRGIGSPLEVQLAIAILETKKEIRELGDKLREITLRKDEKETSKKRLVAIIDGLEKEQKDLLTPLREFDALIQDNFKKTLYWEEQYMRYNSKMRNEETGERGAGQQKEQGTDPDRASEHGRKDDKARQN